MLLAVEKLTYLHIYKKHAFDSKIFCFIQLRFLER